MKILFCLRSTVYARNFESTLRMLAEHGHDVHIVADRHWADSDDLVRRLCDAYPSIRYSEPPIVPFNAWSFFGSELRAGIDYLRYLGPEFEDAAKLRVRAERNAPAFVLSILKRPGMNTPRGRALLGRMFATLDRAVPHHPEIEKFVRSCAPDLVLVTPLVEPGSPQSEYVRAARALGIRTGLCVYSWDNLTNKGLIHEPLDVVTVWNDAMKHEAITLHGVPSERIEVTGAAAYDHWFEWQPRESRAEFCGRIGVSADRPFILYVCSSRFIAPQEVDFIRRWVTELRASSETLRNVGVLVRPHPQHFKPWKIKPLSDLERLTVWPGEGANPLDERSRAEYHDSIYHSAAVGLTRGKAGLQEYTDEAVNDPKVRSVRERVTATADNSITEDQSHIEVETADGRKLVRFVEQSLGNVHRPLSDSQLEDKLRDQSIPLLGEAQVEKLIALCWKIDQLEDVSEVIRATVRS